METLLLYDIKAGARGKSERGKFITRSRVWAIVFTLGLYAAFILLVDLQNLWLKYGLMLLLLVLTGVFGFMHSKRQIRCLLQKEPLCLITNTNWGGIYQSRHCSHLATPTQVRVAEDIQDLALGLELLTEKYESRFIVHYEQGDMALAVKQCQQVAEFLDICNAGVCLFDLNGHKFAQKAEEAQRD